MLGRRAWASEAAAEVPEGVCGKRYLVTEFSITQDSLEADEDSLESLGLPWIKSL